ncbi:MAG TPA: hypothetical protein PKM65_00630 [Spirochaetota bacterium]|nr:hypothetical protein [Spirochaetota bacterium]HNT11677.1 hypothetical protein [Spirochaetota bacterium]
MTPRNPSEITGDRIGRLLLPLVLLLALAIRLPGINWGMPPDGVTHYPSLHPDEIHVMKALKQIRPEKLDFNPESAHIEGTLNYYLWATLGGVLWLTGTQQGWDGYHRMLLMGRLSTVMIDLAAVVLMYLLLLKILGSGASALLGAVIFAIIPFEAMHSVYMRTHTLSNLLILAVIYASLLLYERNEPRRYLLIGLLVGLSAANRYIFITTIIIPGCFILYREFFVDRTARCSIRGFIDCVLNANTMIMLAGVVLGLFLGDMPLFFRFEEVKPYLMEQFRYSRASSGSIVNILSLSRLAQYFRDVIPTGTFLLWIPFYLSFGLVYFIREYRRFIIPITPFFVIYIYLMSKGYPLITMRTVLPLMPFFTIITACVAHAAYRRMQAASRPGAIALLVATGFILGSTALYGFALTRAMGRTASDPFHQLYDYITHHAAGSSRMLRIGFLADSFWDSIIVVNVRSVLEKATGGNCTVVTRREDMATADFVVVYNIGPGIERKITADCGFLEARYGFGVHRRFKREITLAGQVIDYRDFPHDFHYPFPVLFLMKRDARGGAGGGCGHRLTY